MNSLSRANQLKNGVFIADNLRWRSHACRVGGTYPQANKEKVDAHYCIAPYRFHLDESDLCKMHKVLMNDSIAACIGN